MTSESLVARLSAEFKEFKPLLDDFVQDTASLAAARLQEEARRRAIDVNAAGVEAQIEFLLAEGVSEREIREWVDG